MSIRPLHVTGLLAVLFVCLWAMPSSSAQSTLPTYRDVNAPLEARVDDLFGRLTEHEKLSLLTGTAFTTTPLPRLGIPGMSMADAGQGVRGGMPSTLGPATLFPSGVTMASTWDPDLVKRIGQAIGLEALNKGTGAQVLLGPAVNIHRSPLGGRNGEYFSEDPYLASRLAVGYIQGMQSTGCAACLKHYACNNEEVDRQTVNVTVDPRALCEIYLPAFEAGVKEGHAWTLMSSYNLIGGFHATANRYLLTDVLKRGWGFDGMVMSDWGAVHETVRVVNAGNDLEMPGPGLLAPAKVATAMARGQISQATVDGAVHRILRTIIRAGVLNSPRVPDHALVNSAAHRQLAYEAATKAIVLLKNDGGVLPLRRDQLHSIAVIGPAALGLQMGAAGSPGLTPLTSVQPLDGIRQRAGSGIVIHYAQGTGFNGPASTPIPLSAYFAPGGGHGLRAEYFANRNLAGAPAFTRTDPQLQLDWDKTPPRPHFPRTDFSVRWTSGLVAPVTGRYSLLLNADDGCRVFLDGQRVIDHWINNGGDLQTARVALRAGRPYRLRVDYYQAGGGASIHLAWGLPSQPRFAAALQAARQSDVAIVLVGTSGTEGEGQDRPSMSLPGEQDDLIRAVAAVNKRTVVVLNNGTPCLMTGWLDKVPGLVEAWFPGQQGGEALAAILFGDVDPSGKLPDTLAMRREDYPDYRHFPGTNGQLDYAEGIYVGYRHFDKAGVTPLFPFGYGLSYTTFGYSNLRLSQPTLDPQGTIKASVDITNTGQREGAEVVQLYIHDPDPKIDKPVRELKGFQKLDLKPGETGTVQFTLAPRALAYCDVPGKQWKADGGDYEIEVGASSRDIRQQTRLHLTADYTESISYLGK